MLSVINKIMELKYGNKRVFELSLAAAITLGFFTYFVTEKNFVLAFGILVITLWTFRGVLRFFFCSRWIKVKASIVKIEDQASIKFDWRGIATILSQYKVKTEYTVHGKLYETDIFLNQLPEDGFYIYYKPENPEIVSSKIGLGWEGIAFIAFLSLGALYGIIIANL